MTDYVFNDKLALNFGSPGQHVAAEQLIANLRVQVKNSLAKKIQQLFVLLIGGLGIVVLATFLLLTEKEVVSWTKRDVESTTRLLEMELGERASALKAQSSLLSSFSEIRSMLANTRIVPLENFLGSLMDQLSVDGIAVANSNGRLLFSTDRQDKDSNPWVWRGVFLALQGKSHVFATDGERGIYLAATCPVKEDDRILGTVTVYLLIGDSFAKQFKRVTGADILFIDEGVPVGGTIQVKGALPSAKMPSRTIQMSGKTYASTFGTLGKSLPGHDIDFVMFRDMSEISDRNAKLVVVFVSIISGALLISILLSSSLLRKVTRQLEGVVNAARKLQEGEWPERFRVESNDEIGLLQSAFNSMSSSLKASQEQLVAMLDLDPLTETMNHRCFNEQLEKEAARWEESKDPLSLLLIDIDHFKQFNQAHGHAKGDEMLCSIARLLRELVPRFASVARYAGEKFAVILPRANLDQAEELAEQLREMIESQPLSGLTVSIACAEYGSATAKPEGLVLACELGISRAKQLGRNRVCRFDNLPGADSLTDPYQLHQFIQDGSLSTIQALAAAVDAKDPYTKGHSIRVAEYAAALAQKMQYPESFVQLVYRTGTLHDVGKIGVPDSILKKPTWLDEEERKLMETHPAIGEVIVRKAPQLADTLPGVRHHHERWDGKGYPDGLAAEEIPLLGRILAIADCYDAMTSDRIYRKGMAIDAALDEIEKGAGKQFDPELAPVFVQMMRSKPSVKAA